MMVIISHLFFRLMNRVLVGPGKSLIVYTVPTHSGKSWNFYWKMSKTWNILKITLSRKFLEIYLQGLGNC